MRKSLLALVFPLLLPATAAAQLESPEASCFEPVKPACAEVTVGSEDEGWAMRCQEELTSFLEDLDDYRQCVDTRLERMRRETEAELQQMSCLVEPEAQDC